MTGDDWPSKRDVRAREILWQRERRRQRRREIRCFWTRPFGHAYVDHQCVACGRYEVYGA